MERALTMPKLGMTMTEGTVLQWLYKEGERVEKGEPLVEVMTDKVNMEVEAPFGGILKSILASDGAVLPIGAPLATLVDEEESSPAIVAPVAASLPVAASYTAGQAIASTPATLWMRL